MSRPLSRRRLLRQRLATQRVTSGPLPAAADVVRLLTCVQSQERDHALWSLAMRSEPHTYDDVRGELDAGAFLRTHILRPTWHFVAPEDLRWIQALTGGRVLSGLAARQRQLGLDDDRVVGQALDALGALLDGGPPLTRRELGEAFAARSVRVTAGEQLGHLLIIAECRGLVCSGPTKGVHHTYALVDGLLPPEAPLDRDEAVARLVHRFFAGHGPASDRDFARWSGLTLGDTRAALAHLRDVLAEVVVEGTTLWFDPAVVARRSPRAPAAHLFPEYDEAVLTYPALGFPAPADHPYDLEQFPYWANVVVGEANVGIWRRKVTARRVEVDVRLSRTVDADDRVAVEAEAARLAAFWDRPLVYRES